MELSNAPTFLLKNWIKNCLRSFGCDKNNMLRTLSSRVCTCIGFFFLIVGSLTKVFYICMLAHNFWEDIQTNHHSIFNEAFKNVSFSSQVIHNSGCGFICSDLLITKKKRRMYYVKLDVCVRYLCRNKCVRLM